MQPLLTKFKEKEITLIAKPGIAVLTYKDLKTEIEEILSKN